MELMSVALARVIWAFDIRDLNPRGINLRHALLPALRDRYQFTTYPSDDELNKFDPEGIKFAYGVFKSKQGEPLAVALLLFPNGIVGETLVDTEESERFLEDVTKWFASDFGLSFREDFIHPKAYVSQVYVRSEARLEMLNPGLRAFQDKLSSCVSIPYETAGINLSTGAEMATKPGNFYFERALNTPFSQNRYWSQAPTSTKTHLELLDDLERLLAG